MAFLEIDKIKWLPFAERIQLGSFSVGFKVQTGPVKAKPVLLRQQHTNNIVVLGTGQEHKADAPFDGFIGPGLEASEYAVQTADCLPVVLAHPDRAVLGVMHAGWRGLASGILVKAIHTCAEEFHCPGNELSIVLGPCICVACYEVGGELLPQFCNGRCGIEQKDLAVCFSRKTADKFLLDLRMAAILSLLSAGAQSENIAVIDACTKESSCLPSYRRDGAKGQRLLTTAALG